MHFKDYIQAAYNEIQKGEDVKKVLKSLHAYLKKRGLGKLYPRILRGLIEKIRRAQKSAMPKVTIAREKDLARNKAAIAMTLSHIKAEEHEVAIDPSIIGGFVVTAKGTRIDNSYKKKLFSTYRALQD